MLADNPEQTGVTRNVHIDGPTIQPETNHWMSPSIAPCRGLIATARNIASGVAKRARRLTQRPKMRRQSPLTIAINYSNEEFDESIVRLLKHDPLSAESTPEMIYFIGKSG